MKTSNNGLKFIESYEGLILQSYDDAGDHIVKEGESARGTLTIGYGHTSAAGSPQVVPGMVITKEQANDILAKDLSKVEADVKRMVKVPLNQNQFDSLVSFHFNTGSLGKSSALKSLNDGNYEEAADRLTLYNRGRVGGQLVPMNGLVRRREAEKKMFLSKPATGGKVATTGAVVVAGATAASNAPHHYLPYIIAGTAIAAFAVWVAWEWYHFSKTYIAPTVTNSVTPAKTESKVLETEKVKDVTPV